MIAFTHHSASRIRSVFQALLAVSITATLTARELVVDQRGGTEFRTLRAATDAVNPGDTIIIAQGSGPYRETLYIRKSGTPDAPITVEGNGETITGFATLTGFHREDATGAWICRLPQPFPLVLTFQGQRILQDQATGRLLGPLILRDGGQTIELAPGTPTEGWEVSSRLNAVQLNNASHHVYRNITATGATNDGFNLHGAGVGLLFEKITAAQNLDEGFSAHGTIDCEIRGGEFWGNDNGIGNIGDSVMRAIGIKIHNNLGWGLWLANHARAELSSIQAWGNGVSQIRFDRQTTGSCHDVFVWPMPAPTRPWVTYKETASLTATSALGGATTTPDPSRWAGFPQISSAPVPASGNLSLPIPPQATVSATALTTLIRNAIASGQTQLRLPAGTLRLSQTIEIRGASQLEIDGTGTTLVMTNTRHAILRIRESKGLTIRGLTLDYDPLPFTQGTITKASESVIEFRIHDGYPSLNNDYQHAPVHFFTADGRRHPGSWDFNRLPLEILNPREGRLKLQSGQPAPLSIGDQLVMDRRNVDGTSAVYVRNCTGPITFEDTTLHASPGLAFVGRYSDDTVTFRRVRIHPGPPPREGAQPRLLSSNADGINFVQCRRGPIVENCAFSGMGDDSINLHGFLIPVIRPVTPTRFLAAYKYGPGDIIATIRPGDALRLYNQGDFSLAGQATITAIKALDTKENVTMAHIASLFPTYPKGEYTIYQVDLDSPLEVKPGQWFDTPANNCNGYVIRDNYFHDHRGRALRLMASDGLVANNRFERLTKSAISIGPELGYWREAGWVNNLLITGNTLRDIGVDHSLAAPGSYVPGAIGIFARTERTAPPYPSENHNITIEKNRIENTTVSAIHAYAARDVIVRDNTLVNTNLVLNAGYSDPSTHLFTAGPVSLQNVSDAVMENNTIEKN